MAMMLGRSSQHWQHVSNNEGVHVDEDDLAIPLKKARSTYVGSNDQKHVGVTRSCSNFAVRLNQNGVALPHGDVQKNNSKTGIINKHVSDSDVIHFPSAEFSDLDIHIAENCFAVNQIWACNDTADGMPRFDAHIRKVYDPEFKVKLRWLEANPENELEVAWVRADLPVVCFCGK